jgi:hypothetical protein
MLLIVVWRDVFFIQTARASYNFLKIKQFLFTNGVRDVNMLCFADHFASASSHDGGRDAGVELAGVGAL